MRLTARALYDWYQPSECALRVWLKARGEAEAEPSEYQKILHELGRRHELRHLATLGESVDLSKGTLDERVHLTVEAMQAGQRVLYQPVLVAPHAFDGVECELMGIPDVCIRQNDGNVIRDCKISRHADEELHYETILQLGFYGFLYERTVGKAPLRLEVLLGDGTLQEVPYDGGIAALSHLERVFRTVRQPVEFYEPVGWSKCNGCGYYGRCWKKAEGTDDVARVYGVDQAIARVLHEQGIENVTELLANLDETSLGEISVPRGSRVHRVGKKATEIFAHAHALSSKELRLISKPALPLGENFAFFDIEGLPPQVDELEKIYLWGIQVFGKEPSEYFVAFANFGEDGDRQGWLDFLQNCKRSFERYGNLPILHWTPYERTYLHKYIKRHGDLEGIAGRVDRNLVDLFPIVKDCVVLPSPTYGLKAVEEYTGFTRKLNEADGQWAMATYIKAVETEDTEERDKLKKQIIEYNKEDLAGAWAAFEWLRGL